MEKQITLKLAALLLGSAILFASCTKETLQAPKESLTASSINGPSINSNASEYFKTLKVPIRYTDCGSSPIQYNQPVTFRLEMTGNNQEVPSMELWEIEPGHSMYAAKTSVPGYKEGPNYVVSIMETFTPGTIVYIRVSGKSGWHGFINPTVKTLSVSYQLIFLPGTSQTMRFTMQPT